jgi:predicted exporter
MRPEAFQPYLDNLQRTANGSSRAPADGFTDAPLQDLVNSQVYFDGDDWISLTTLFGLHEPNSLAQLIEATLPAATVVDLKGASESLIEQYRQRVLLLLGAAFLAIVGFLCWRIGPGSRLLWVCGTLLAAVFLTSALTALVLGQLSLFSLFSTVLVAGLGLDYALFASRTEVSFESRRDTLHALTICALSTLLAFLILGFSSVPILQAIGVTVAIGVALNYTLTLVGAYHR